MASAGLSTKTVVVADDTAFVRDRFRTALEHAGHRVVVMSARPCRPKQIFEIDIPHPRDYGVLTSKRFREIAAEVADAVNEEAVKSFARGEREA